MNERRVFVPSDQMRRASAAEPVEVKPATKATHEEPRADELSAEEIAFARKLAADPREGMAIVRDNGVIVCANGEWIGPRIWEQ